MISKRATIAALAAIVAAVPAHAAVTISTAPTQNMNCAGGTCMPTATKAVLNATDLQNYLSQFGNVWVVTTGSGVEAKNIVVNAAFTTPDATSLTLEAYRFITVNAAVSIGANVSQLELEDHTGDTLSFGPKGHITFGSLLDTFGYNGAVFTLEESVQELATAIAANPSGYYALAGNYDATQDGTYTSSPVATAFTGSFEGFGNTISHLSISDSNPDNGVGLFADVGVGGAVANLRLAKVKVRGVTPSEIGTLAGLNEGILFGDSAEGSASTLRTAIGRDSLVGGLVGYDDGGSIRVSHADVTVNGTDEAIAVGGLVGLFFGGDISDAFATGNVSVDDSGLGEVDVGGLVGVLGTATINESYATGDVSAGRGDVPSVGGLVGGNAGKVENCYATGNVSSLSKSADIGGFAGMSIQNGLIGSSYSVGVPSGPNHSIVGGFLGDNEASLSDAYWDTTTSGTNTGVGKGSDSGVTGLTTSQLQSGLPAGFDRKIWTESPNINNGLPYLIANPPPK